MQRFNFFGTAFTAFNLKLAIDAIQDYNFSEGGYVCFPDTFVVSLASKNVELNQILRNSAFTMPDGSPSALVGRLMGYKKVSTVSGFHLCKGLLQRNLSHYFYGADKFVIEKMMRNIIVKYPSSNILGYKAPPRFDINEISSNEIIKNDFELIRSLNPDLVWIGVSSPKQDFLMHHYSSTLDRSLLLGVGGVFLYFAEEGMKSPEWVKKFGLRWLYRLCKEPRRLASKYFTTILFLFSRIPEFLILLLKAPFLKAK